MAVAFDNPGALHIVALTPLSLHAFLRGTPATPIDEVEPMVLLPPGNERWIDVLDPGTTVLLRFTSGTVRLCP